MELCEPSASMLATALEEPWAAGLPVHTALEDALASRPHAVVLCTPHTLHAEQAIAALDACQKEKASAGGVFAAFGLSEPCKPVMNFARHFSATKHSVLRTKS